MSASVEKSMLIADLQHQILQWQGFKQIEKKDYDVGLGELEKAFPGHVFPVGTLHEFMSENNEEDAASSGFIAALLSFLIQKGGVGLWISSSSQLFAPSIKLFGVDPDRIIFVQMEKHKDILWALEEGLKCEGIRVVIAEVQDIDFVQSRRLQLAVEKSKVTGFVLRLKPRFLGTTICAARWHIRSLPSHVQGDMPGVGFPEWEVELLKVRNGSPSRWQVGWRQNQLQAKRLTLSSDPIYHAKRKVG
ncbi:ImuA family protein [Sphingobacterium sp. SGR-19]|uniref:ImuA family protein n=1 Tax=Sphingobacterium sp. SGR-19 TaxID=2710886 RepID=UPI0013EADEC8|nr:Error-prone repair protein ImuA [Sphingobacterium sp. SGR-19]NGM63688.1 Error-prone repair protein ImuA [Sphingobacterium sp. SGR-19]